MLENVRFEPAETSKDDAERAGLARRLAALAGPGGVYVGDGFGALHRKHASVYDLPGLLPHAAGRPGAGRGRGAAPADRPTRRGPTWWCSAAPSRPTSSA